VKTLADELEAFYISINEEIIIIILLESLPSLFDNLIVAMEIKALKELTLDFLTRSLVDA